MELDPIFATESQSETDLWAIIFDDINEFDIAFENWFDSEYLLDFFTKNKNDLFSGFFKVESIEQAIEATLNEAYQFEELLLSSSFKYGDDKKNTLIKIFNPLNDNDYHESDLQKNKVRPKTGYSWLRLYAIRLKPNSFVVSGGAIKLTKNMKAPHLEKELLKLEKTKHYLSTEGIIDSEELNKLLS